MFMNQFPQKWVATILVVVLSTMSVYAQINATITPKASNCPSNGEITLSNFAGGEPPYEAALISGPSALPSPLYETTNAAGNLTFTGLRPGTYAISIKDVTGKEQTLTTTVGGNYQLMNYTATPSVSACNNGTPGTGTISVTGVTGGVGPYMYALLLPNTPTVFQNSGTFTNLLANTQYEIQVWDECSNFETRQVRIPAASPPLVVNGPAFRFTACDGTVSTTFTTSGGATPYTATMSPSASSPSPGVYNLNTSTSYTYTVKDNCGNTEVRNFTTPGKPNQVLSVGGAGATGCSGTGGVLNISVQGGIGPYTGTIVSTACGVNRTLNLQANGDVYSESVTNLNRPCTYTITVTDACGNVSTKEEGLVGGSPGSLGTYREKFCPVNGDLLDRLKIGVTNGPPYNPTPPYTFELFNSSNQMVAGFPQTPANGGMDVTVPLTADTYTFRITDGCGTTSQLETAIIGEYIPPTVRIDLNSACISAGQVTLISSGQNPLAPGFKEYKIIAGPERVGESNNFGVFSNLISEATYTFEFYDGCRYVTSTITMPKYEKPTFEVGFGVICAPETTACLMAIGLEGTIVKPYQFEIIPFGSTGNITSTPPQADSLFCGLTAGNYNIRGFDGCKNSFTYLGKVGPLPIPEVLVSPNPACEGVPVRIRPRTMIYGANYTFTRNGVVIYNGPRGILTTPAVAGDINIKTEVTGGCKAESIVPFQLLPKGNLVITNPDTTCSAATVDLTAAAVTAGSSTGTLTYWKDATATQALDAATGPANAIQLAGEYYIKLSTTGPSCNTIKKVTVVFKPTPDAPTVAIVQPNCAVSTGTITVTAPTGTTYSFNNGGAYQTANVSAALPAGTYQVLARATNGCVSSATSAQISPQPVSPQAPTASAVHPTCLVPTGIITVTAPTTGVTYSYDDGLTYQNSNQSPALASGTYQVKVKNAVGCESTAISVVINPRPALPATPVASVTQPTCTVATGIVTITPQANVTYSFDNGATYQASNVSAALATGTYLLKTRTPDGCESEAVSVVVTRPLVTPVAPTVSVEQTTCLVATGIITVTTPSDVTYSFNGGESFQPFNTSGSLPAGTYSVSVKNSDECVSAATSAVINTQPVTPPAPTVTVVQPTCDVATGTITVTAPSDVTYSFDNGATYQAASTSSPLLGGTAYQIKVKNAVTCESAATPVTLIVQPATPTLTLVGITCLSNLRNYVITYASNGTVTSTAGVVNATLKTVTVPVGVSVTLTAISSDNCPRRLAVAAPNIQSPVSGGNKTICVNDIIPALTVTVGANESANWYSASGMLLEADTTSYTPTAAGSYFVETINTISSCKSVAKTEVKLIINPRPNVSATGGVIGCNTATTPATATSTDAGVTYQWAGPGVTAGGTTNQATANAVGIYTVTATLTGCTSTDTAQVSKTLCSFDLAMKKELVPPTATLKNGDLVTFKLTVVNQGTLNATAVQITDYVPAGLTLEDSLWVVTAGKATLKTPIALLAAGGSTVLNISFRISPTFQGTSIRNAAEISDAKDWTGSPVEDVDSTPDDTNGNQPGEVSSVDNDLTGNGKNGGDEDDHDFEVIQIQQTFDLAMTKKLAAGQAATVNPGDAVKFTISVVNQGSINATAIRVTDYVPTGMTFEAAANPNWTLLNGLPTATIDSLAAGATAQLDIILKVGATFQGTSAINIAEISDAKDGAGNTATDVDSRPDVNATNDAGGQANTPADDTLNGNGTGQPNDANAATDEDDSDPAVIGVKQVFDLALTKQLAAGQATTVKQGSKVKFVITVLNQGTLNATAIKVSDYVPFGMTFVPTDNATWAAGAVPTATIATLLAGASTSLEITLTVNADFRGLALTNRAEVSDAKDGAGNNATDIDSRPDTNPANDAGGKENTLADGATTGNGTGTPNTADAATDEDDSDPALVNVEPIFDLAIRKNIVGTIEVHTGSPVVFEITVSNQGNVPAYNVEVIDYLPAGMSLIAGNGWTASRANIVQTIPGPIAPNTSVVLTLTLRVDANFTGTNLTNTVEITKADDDTNPNNTPPTDVDSTPDNNPNNDPTGEDDTDTELVPIFKNPSTTPIFDLALTKKKIGTGPYSAGGLVSYEIAVLNQGNVPAFNVEVIDHIPTGMTLVAGNGWTTTANKAKQTIAGPIAVGASVNLVIVLQIDNNFTGTKLVNSAEISKADNDRDTTNTQPTDSDSSPNNGPNNDTVNEDDNDSDIIELLPQLAGGVFDLAIVKKHIGNSIYSPGDTVTFNLTVMNQGTVPAFDVQITDYIPTGMTLADATWNLTGNSATKTIAGPIAMGAIVNATIKLRIIPTYKGERLINEAEISKADDDQNSANTPPVDIDGVFDGIQTNNGTPKDDVTNEDKLTNPDSDLDNADIDRIDVTPEIIIDCKPPEPAIGLSATVCIGAPLPKLVVLVETGLTADWFTTQTGGTKVAGDTIAYQPAGVAVTDLTFYVESKSKSGSCTTTGRTPVTITVKPSPTLIAELPRCATDRQTYSFKVTSNGTLTTTDGIGTVVNNNNGTFIITASVNQAVTVVATSADNCKTQTTVQSPNCDCPPPKCAPFMVKKTKGATVLPSTGK